MIFSRAVCFHWGIGWCIFCPITGTDANGAIFAARRVAMKKVGKMIDTRTQTMARHICSNC